MTLTLPTKPNFGAADRATHEEFAAYAHQLEGMLVAVVPQRHRREIRQFLDLWTRSLEASTASALLEMLVRAVAGDQELQQRLRDVEPWPLKDWEPFCAIVDLFAALDVGDLADRDRALGRLLEQLETSHAAEPTPADRREPPGPAAAVGSTIISNAPPEPDARGASARRPASGGGMPPTT